MSLKLSKLTKYLYWHISVEFDRAMSEVKKSLKVNICLSNVHASNIFVAKFNAYPLIVRLRLLFDQLSLLFSLSRYSKMDFFEFFSMARNFRLGEMLRRRTVKERLALSTGGMSFTEFSYQILQAYDWARLYKEYGCQVQMGGIDQLGHFDMGRSYAKKVRVVLLTECADSKALLPNIAFARNRTNVIIQILDCFSLNLYFGNVVFENGTLSQVKPSTN